MEGGITVWHWAGFVAAVVVLLALDLGVFHRRAREVRFREALGWTGFWVLLALSFGFWIYQGRSRTEGLEFLTGYLIELSLSMDNVFVMALIFGYFAVPLRFQHRVLFWGIMGAIILRGVMIAAGAALISRFHWVLYLLGAFLVVTGVRMLFGGDTKVEPERNFVLRLARRYFPVSDGFDGQRFVTVAGGRRMLTPMALVLIMVETTDLVFALDSIPAIFAVTRDPFIVFTSNVFAILGLRSLYFALAGAIAYFRYLKVGLSLVLAFIGLKMLLGIVHLKMDIGWALGVVVGILGTSVLASLVRVGGKAAIPRRRRVEDYDAMKHRWMVAPSRPELAAAIVRQVGVSPLLAQCLINRDFTTPETATGFLEPRLRDLADPFLLPGMTGAVERLVKARTAGEPLVIYGDYDVDGVTSTALLLEVFEKLGWKVRPFLPHRMDEGYGLSTDGVEHCLDQHPVKLLLAVDCGSTAVEAIRSLRERGVDVLVLDHHQLADPPPMATALVNPRLGGDRAPGTELCSAGLAFKLAHALVKRGRELGWPGAADLDLRTLLDLVALGTIADLVPLRRENRALVRSGLERLNQTQRPGLQALCEVAQITSSIGGYEVGFLLSPRLNAAGRLEDAREALDLLRAEDYATATRVARSLDARNRQRQQIEKAMADEVITALDARFDPETDYVIVEGQRVWHIGVVGIVASRVLQRFYRPTIIVGGDGEAWRGSGRSVEGFDLAAALRQCDGLLLRHGGHAMAAGLSLQPENLDALRRRLNELARAALRPEQLLPPLRLDGVVGLSELTETQINELDRLRPTGQGNPPVQLIVTGLTHERPPQRVGKERQHAKFWVTDGRVTREAIWYAAGARPAPEGVFEIACVPHVHEFNGRRSVQMKVLDWRPVEAAAGVDGRGR